ncbi:MAG: hypothetical protein KF729_21900 [Sandaracinaceae bacterium]|nr:hypothetical protein [Sandaracinaceae bacterium]
MRHARRPRRGAFDAGTWRATPAAPALDAGTPPARPDASAPRDAAARPDGATELDAGADAGDDAAAPDGSLAALRDALFATYSAAPCASWAALDRSQRAVFLTLTHRLHTSRLPDGRSVLEHIDRLYLVLGGGSSGTTCGGAANNRLFLSMDDVLWTALVATWERERIIDDGGGGAWVRTRDAAGPHAPFDASTETETGLDCVLLFERSGSRPPTAQAHFFLEGSAARVERGAGISLEADPYMLEIDHDFDCLHDSNPICDDHERRYRDNHGDFECGWVPSACTPAGDGCYRSAS